MYLTIFLWGKWKVFKGAGILKLIVSFLPALLALFVAVTRWWDNHHRLLDISVGSMIGIFFAFIGYFLYFPSLLDDNCDVTKNRYESFKKKST